jgi:ribosomal protein L40E
MRAILLSISCISFLLLMGLVYGEEMIPDPSLTSGWRAWSPANASSYGHTNLRDNIDDQLVGGGGYWELAIVDLSNGYTNVKTDATDQDYFILYNASTESSGKIQWHAYEDTSWPWGSTQVTQSDFWTTFSLSNSNKVYFATLSFRYAYGSDDMNGSQSTTTFSVLLTKPDGTTVTLWSENHDTSERNWYTNPWYSWGSSTYYPNPPSWLSANVTGILGHFNQDGTYKLTFRVYVKLAEKKERFHWWMSSPSLQIKRDFSPPVLSFISIPDNYINYTSVTFSWSASDAESGLHSTPYSFRLDENPWSVWSTSTSCTFSGLTEGNHTFYVKARDAVGNESIKTYTFKVDMTPPTNGYPSSPANDAWINASPVVLTWSAGFDSGSGISFYEWQIDDSPTFETVKYSGTSNTTSASVTLPEGRWYWRIRARDAAGNYSAWSSAYSFKVDRTPPTNGSPTSPPDGSWINTSPIVLTWSPGSDSLSGVSGYEWQVDDDPSFSSPNYSGTSTSTSASISPPEGKWYWRVKTKDIAGNCSAWSKTFSFSLDRTAPSINKIKGPDYGEEIHTSYAIFEWSATDSFSGVSSYFYRTSTDGGKTWSSWTETVFTSWTWQQLRSSSSTYMFQVCAQDRAGNRSEPVTWYFRVSLPSTATFLEVQPESFVIKKGESIRLTATLLSSNKPVTDKTITWTASAGILSTSITVTDSNGKAAVVYTAPDAEEFITITVSFAGDSQLAPTQAIIQGRVLANVIVLTFTKPDGSPFVLTRVYRCFDSTREYLGVTDSDGKITLSPDQSLLGREVRFETEDGTYAATAILQGDSRISLLPKAGMNRGWIYLVILVAIAGGSLASIIAWRKEKKVKPQKKAIQEPETRAYIPIYCSKCKAANFPGAKFCGKCGASLEGKRGKSKVES